MKSRGVVFFFLLLSQVIVIIGSWIASVLVADGSIHSLLTAEGVRWFIGDFSRMLSTPVLFNILIVGMAVGVIRESHILTVMLHYLRSRRRADAITPGITQKGYSELIALQLSIATALVMVVVIILLSCLPHAILLSATGTVLNSSLFSGLIPMLCFVAISSATLFGYASRHFQGFLAVFRAMEHGVTLSAPFILFYIFALQLYILIMYVIGA